MAYARTDPAKTPDYAQHLTPEAAAWLEARHDPSFTPKKHPHRILRCRPLGDTAREKAQRENDAWLQRAGSDDASEVAEQSHDLPRGATT